MTRPLVVIGDALLDRDVRGHVERLSPDAQVPVLDEASEVARPGGAALAAALAAADGEAVTLVAALGGDAAAGELRALLTAHGVDMVALPLAGRTPEKVRFHTERQALMRLDRGGGPGPVGEVPAAARAAIDWAGALLVSDYGRGVAASPSVRDAVRGAVGRIPTVWDPHPLGAEPIAGVSVATPNASEVERLEPAPKGSDTASAAQRALAMVRRWDVEAVCMTRGAGGALLSRAGRPPLVAPAPVVSGGDPCGAGDRFASRLVRGLARGHGMETAVEDAVACASRFVADGGAGGLPGVAAEPPGVPRRLHGGDALDLSRAVRRAGGTVVATGGCFDLLHAGHLRTLGAARELGDALIVCLNSDASVRRLKGAGRPIVPEEDRAAILGALSCVDAVCVFGEDTPERILGELRPHIWVKGGDYGGEALPEEGVLRRWGGRIELVAYFEGHSTTQLIEEASCRV